MNKLCECGCGMEVKIDRDTKKPNRFIVSHALRSEEVQEKFKRTSRINHGVDHPMKSEAIQKKCEKIWQNTLGVNNPMKSKKVMEKSKLTLLERYGFDNYSKTPEGRKISRENLIDRTMKGYKNNLMFSPQKGLQEKTIINEIQTYCPYPILIDQKFISYFPDGYIKELNLIIEVYEPWHHKSWSVKHDIIRQKDLEDHLNCKFFIIDQEEWKENKEKIISDFKEVINGCTEK